MVDLRLMPVYGSPCRCNRRGRITDAGRGSSPMADGPRFFRSLVAAASREIKRKKAPGAQTRSSHRAEALPDAFHEQVYPKARPLWLRLPREPSPLSADPKATRQPHEIRPKAHSASCHRPIRGRPRGLPDPHPKMPTRLSCNSPEDLPQVSRVSLAGRRDAPRTRVTPPIRIRPEGHFRFGLHPTNLHDPSRKHVPFCLAPAPQGPLRPAPSLALRRGKQTFTMPGAAFNEKTPQHEILLWMKRWTSLGSRWGRARKSVLES